MLGDLTADNEGCLSSTMCDSNPAPISTTPGSEEGFAPLDYTVATQCAYSSTLTHTSNAKQGLLAQGQLGNLKGIGLNEWVARKMEGVVEGQQVTKGSELVAMPVRTLSLSTASWPTSTAPHNFNSALSSTTPTPSSPNMVNNASNTSLSMYNAHTISPLAQPPDHHKYLGSLHACPPTPFFLKQPCSSLLPPFHQPILNHDSADFDAADFDFNFEFFF